MATFKEFINIEQADNYTLPTEKIDLRKFTGAPLSVAPTISNIIKPNFTGNSFGNSFINKKYIVVSFALSRDDAETFALRYNTPRLYLSVRGSDYSGASKVINIYSNKNNDGDGFSLRWDGNFAIGRVKIKTQDIKSLNEIIEIGICIVRESSPNEMVGRHFVFGSDNKHDSNFTVNSYQYFDNINVAEKGGLASINKYASDFSLTAFNETIKISPQSIVPTIQIKGTYSQRRSYKNTKYYKDEIFCEQAQYNLFGVADKASALIIYNENNGQLASYLPSEDGFYIDPNLLSDNMYYVYGGYQYNIETKNTLEPIGNFNNTQTDKGWKTKFFIFFSYIGDRYRTKFYQYVSKDTVEVKSHVMNGTLDLIKNSDCPYAIKNKSLPSSIVTQSENIKIQQISLLNTDKEKMTFGTTSFFYPQTIEMTNLFTNEVEPFTLNIPLVDEYQYYLLGEDIYLTQKNSSKIKTSVLNEQEFVWYTDANLVVDQKDAKLYDITRYEFISINDDNENWVLHESLTPLKNPSKTSIKLTEDGKDETKDERDKTLFQYWFQQYFLNNIDVTEKVKRIEDFSYYTVIRCLKEGTVEFEDNKVIYSDGKINYKFTEMAGDSNSKFSYLDFIKYAIDENKSIRLSQKLGGRTEILEIYGIKNYGKETEEKMTGLIGYLQSNSNDYRELLQYFYTNINQSLSLGKLTDLNLEALQGISGLYLKYFITYPNNTNYQQVIFETKVVLQIINGIRPLGLRKNGIIINPLTPTEELGGNDRVFGKINAFVGSEGQYKIEEEGKETIIKDHYGKATFLDMYVYDKAGNLITDRNGKEAKNAIYYGQNASGYSGWFFDGVNVKDFERQTLGDQKDSLKKKIENNADNLQALSSALSDGWFNILSDSKTLTNQRSTVSAWTEDIVSVTFEHELIKQADYILPTYFVVWSEGSKGDYKNYINDVAPLSIIDITRKDKTYVINFRHEFQSRTSSGNYSNYTLYTKLLLMKFPNKDLTSS